MLPLMVMRILFMQQIVKDKKASASIPTSSAKIKKQRADYRQQKRQQFDQFGLP